jgi:hypothetical protein
VDVESGVGVSLNAVARRVLGAFRVSEEAGRTCSFAFSSRPAPSGWEAYVFDLPLAFYVIVAPGGSVAQVRSLVFGVGVENFVLLAQLDGQVVLALRRARKDDSEPFLVSLRRDDDVESAVNAIRKFDFVSGALTAHASLSSVVDSFKGGAERHFVNRGLFSTYFLRERMSDHLTKRGRNPSKEAAELIDRFGEEFPADSQNAVRVLESLGFSVEILSTPRDFPEYALRFRGAPLDVACVVADVGNLDVRTVDKVAPSYQAVAALQRKTWVVLTNGRLWRLYSRRVSSSSTNYFEVDLEDVAAETDARLGYFVLLFSANSFLQREGLADVDSVFDEGNRHARGIEENLKEKLFDGELFLSLVKAVLGFDASKVYSQQQLDDAKGLALKLLYRLLFVLYAESRGLLPVGNARYKEVSLEHLQQTLTAFEKEPKTLSIWDQVRLLFSMISKGDVDANLPQYDGELFESDPALDGISVGNKFLVSALRDLMEFEGRGIDYQNLGVRHLGSLYEALLEYLVGQAKEPLVVYKEEILDAKYAEDLKQKPLGFIEKGELYLSVKGLARKGTGSYYTPDEIVVWLVKNGLEPQLKTREKRFTACLEALRASKIPDPELEKKCSIELLGLKVLDPAMGSGHFLVAAVNEVTRWIIGLLKENPDAPLLREIEEYRKEIVETQRKRGIRLDEDLLTDNVILKRLVMKRCVYGVDINPLAVELAKVSLWLDSFTIGTPLTFLDHHIRCGDSLIGLWVEVIAPKVFETTLEKWTGAVSTAGASLVEGVALPADLTVEQVTQSREAYMAVREKTRPLCVLLDMFCAGVIDPELEKRLPKNLGLVEEAYRKKGERPKWWSFIEDTLRLAEKYRFFHWELEFPDAFTRDKRGFDLVVMNPPWDVVKPEDDDFFSIHRSDFRRIRSKPEKRKIMDTLLKDDTVAEAYREYRKNIEDRVRFFKESGEYVRRGSGDTNCWKLFLERSLSFVDENGSFALVVPSGIVTDEGGKQLREALFKGRIRAMYEFENRRGIFPDVHRSYKFVLLVADRTAPAPSFPAAFYLQETEALEGKTERNKFVEIPFELVKISAPESLSIPEPRNNVELEIIEKIYDSHSLIGNPSKSWSIKLIRELDFPADSGLLRTDGKGWPLYDGKNIHQFIPDFEKTEFSIDPKMGLDRSARHREFKLINKEIHEKSRLVLRRITCSTNVRTVIACVIPAHTFAATNAPIVLPLTRKQIGSDYEYFRNLAYLSGVLNSMVFDFLIRRRIPFTLNFFYIYQTPMPSDMHDDISNEITYISVKLSSIDDRFIDIASALGVEIAPISMKERIELTAKLNALVAKHYGLTREQFEVILQSFEGFDEEQELVSLKDVKWDDTLIRKFNGEVRKRVLPYFNQLISQENKENSHEEGNC